MLNQKKLIQAFGIFWAVFIVLQILFSMESIQNRMAHLHAQLFGSIAKSYVEDVEFTAIKGTPEGEMYFSFYDKGLVEKAQRTGQTTVNVSELYYANDPTYLINVVLIFLIALCLATPLSWRKRIIIAMVSIVVFYLYTTIRMTLRIKNQIKSIGIGDQSGDPNAIFSLHNVDQMMSTLGFVFVFIIVIWVIQVFSKSNLQEMKVRLKL